MKGNRVSHFQQAELGGTNTVARTGGPSSTHAIAAAAVAIVRAGAKTSAEQAAVLLETLLGPVVVALVGDPYQPALQGNRCSHFQQAQLGGTNMVDHTANTWAESSAANFG